MCGLRFLQQVGKWKKFKLFKLISDISKWIYRTNYTMLMRINTISFRNIAATDYARMSFLYIQLLIISCESTDYIMVHLPKRTPTQDDH